MRPTARARELIDAASPPALIIGTVVLATAITLAAGLAITALVEAVLDADGTVTADDRIVDWIDDRRSPALTSALRTATHLADYLFTVSVVVVVGFVLLTKGHRGAAVALIAASIGAMAVTEILKEIIGRDRPPIASRLIDATGHAFPSGHSSQAVACYGGLALVAVLVTRRPGARGAAIVGAAAVALVVGTSRVYLGVHWPSDVLSGWIVGLTWLALVAATTWLLRRLRRPRRWWPSDAPA